MATVIAAQREAAYGNPAEAQQMAAEALKLARVVRASRRKPHWPLPWLAIRREPKLAQDLGNDSRWTRRYNRFGCHRFMHNWR